MIELLLGLDAAADTAPDTGLALGLGLLTPVLPERKEVPLDALVGDSKGYQRVIVRGE